MTREVDATLNIVVADLASGVLRPLDGSVGGLGKGKASAECEDQADRCEVFAHGMNYLIWYQVVVERTYWNSTQVWAARVVMVTEPPLMVCPAAAARVTVLVDQAEPVTLQTANNCASDSGRVDEFSGVLIVVVPVGCVLMSRLSTAADGAMVPVAAASSW